MAVPDVRTFEASEGDYILIACDGRKTGFPFLVATRLSAGASTLGVCCWRECAGMFEAMGMSWDFVANLLKLELQVRRGSAASVLALGVRTPPRFPGVAKRRPWLCAQGTNDNLVETAFRLLNTAYLFGSSDNVSVVLTKLMPQKKTHAAIKRFCYDFSGENFALGRQEASPVRPVEAERSLFLFLSSFSLSQLESAAQIECEVLFQARSSCWKSFEASLLTQKGEELSTLKKDPTSLSSDARKQALSSLNFPVLSPLSHQRAP